MPKHGPSALRRSEDSTVNIVLQFTADQEANALPILLRHLPGIILPDRTYVVDHAVMKVLGQAGVEFHVVERDVDAL